MKRWMQCVTAVAVVIGGCLATAQHSYAAAQDMLMAYTAGHSVLRYDGVTGAYLGEFVPESSGGLTHPIGVTYGPDGHLYVASSGSNQTLKYDGIPARRSAWPSAASTILTA